MHASRIALALAAVAALGLLAQSATAGTYEVWTVDRTNDVIRRWDPDTGTNLGYAVGATADSPMIENPGGDLLNIVQASDYRLYMSWDDGYGHIARYDVDGTNGVAKLVDGGDGNHPGGDWYKGAHWYEINGLALSDSSIYAKGAAWSVQGSGPTLDMRGQGIIWEYALDGTPQGRQDGIRGAMWHQDPGVGKGGDIARLADGTTYMVAGDHIYRFNSSGQWWGPTGVGDTDPITLSTPQAGRADIVAVGDHLYTTSNSGGVVGAGIYRYNLDGSGETALVTWSGYNTGATLAEPDGLAVSPDGTKLFVYDEGYVRDENDEVPEGLKVFQLDGTFVDMIVTGPDAAGQQLMMYEVPEPATMGLLGLGGLGLLIRRRRR